MKSLSSLIICIAISICSYAQLNVWQQSGGPYGGLCSSIIECNGALFASFNNSQTEGGIWKSSNFGASWIDVSGTMGQCYARDMECWNNILVVSTADSVFYTSNSGASWTPLMNGIGIGNAITQICIYQNELYGVLYKGTGESEIHKLTDTSSTWTYSNFQVPWTNSITDVVATDSAVFICSDYSYNIYKSKDNGATWNNAGNNIAFNTTVQTLNGTGNILYASTNNGIYMTTDGGALWKPATNGLQGTNSVCFKMLVKGPLLYAAFTDYSSVSKIVIGSNTWTPCNPIGFPTITASYAIAEQSGQIFIGTIEGIYKSSNNCQNFTPSHTGVKSSLTTAIFKHNNVLLAGCGSLAGIQQSPDYGTTWQTTTTLNNDFSKHFTFYNGDYYATSYKFGVIKSNDGLTWNSSGTGLNATSSRLLNFANKLIASTTSGIFESTNGSNWIAMGTGIPTNTFINIVVEANSNLFALKNNSSLIYASTDSGLTWIIDTAGLSGFSGFKTLHSYKNYVYLFSDYYTFRKNADSTVWQKISNFQYNSISDVADNGRSLISASYTPFKISNDDGTTWQTWNDGLPATNINSRSLFIDNDTVYAATEGLSIWWRDLTPAMTGVQSSTTSLCAGNSFSVTFATNGSFLTGNAFYALLSDSNGSFVNPDTVGSLFATIGGLIPCSIPANQPEGNHYRIRVICTMPVRLCGENNIDLTVYAKTAMGLQPANQKTCVGKNTAFYCTATGSNLMYQWQIDNGGGFVNLLADQHHADVNKQLLLIINPVLSMDNNNYRCVITGTCTPIVTSNSATLSVSNNFPAIITQPVDTNVCETSTAQFNLNANGINFTYQWQVNTGSGFFTDLTNNANYGGVKTQTLQIYNTQLSYNGYQYRCQLTECVFSDIVTLGVYGGVAIIQQPTNQITCAGGTVQFSTAAQGVSLQYLWEENNGNGYTLLSNNATYSGVNTPALKITNATALMNGYTYRCTMDGYCDGLQYATIDATLSVQPSNVNITTQPANLSACEKSDALFYVTATGNLSYQWQINFGNGWTYLTDTSNILGANDDSLIINNVNTFYNGAYLQCIISGCTVTDSVMLTVNTLPVVTLSPFNAVCQYAGPFLLSGGTPTGGTFIGSGVSNNIFNPITSGNGAILIVYAYTDANGCNNSTSQFLVVDTCLSIPQNNINQLSLFPNPFTDVIYIKNNHNLLTLTIYDVMGNEVLKTNSQKETIELNTEKLKSGMYMLQLFDGKNVITKKIIKSQ